MIIKKSIDSSKYDCRCMINMTCYGIMIIVLISLVLITGAPRGVEIPWPIRPIWPTPAKSALRILGKAQHIQVTLYLFGVNMLHNLDLSTFYLDVLFTFKINYCIICINFLLFAIYWMQSGLRYLILLFLWKRVKIQGERGRGLKIMLKNKCCGYTSI